MTRRGTGSLGLCIVVLMATVSALYGQTGSKLIALGWDMPSVETMAGHYTEMEKSPFDGVVIDVVAGRGTAQACPMRNAFAVTPWQRSWFVGLSDQLRACQFRQFTDNFVLLVAGPGNVDWYDDAGWAQVVDHWRAAAWFARRSGLRGIMFDPEHYPESVAQFEHAAQRQHAEHGFSDYCAKARERGAEVMKALAEEYPDIVLFCLFLNSKHRPAANSEHPEQLLAPDVYGLLPAFVDGWMDAIPPGARVIDGCEAAYRYNSEIEYLDASLFVTNTGQRLVSPANRAKYRVQVQPSFGFYLDAYANSPGSAYYINPKGKTPAGRLATNLLSASRAGGEYLWIYGEGHRWWPSNTANPAEKHWRNAIPGIEDSLRLVRDPPEYARQWLQRLAEVPRPISVLTNGDFTTGPAARAPATTPSADAAAAIPGWSFWQEPDSKGSAQWDRDEGYSAAGAARIAGVSYACLTQTFTVQPDQLYIIRAMRKSTGQGSAVIRACWKKDPRGEWSSPGWESWVAGTAVRDQWEELIGVVRVPADVTLMQFQLMVRGQLTPADTTWFDDAAVYRLPG